jgi:hypothetical protein
MHEMRRLAFQWWRGRQCWVRQLVRFDPPRHWGVRGVDGPIRAMVDVTVEPCSDSNAQLTIALDFEGRGIGLLLVPLLVRPEACR